MSLLDTLLSALGLGRSEPDSAGAQSDAETAAAEHREPPASGSDAAADTGSVTEEPPAGKPDEADEVEAAAEPAEAAGPGSQVTGPDAVDGAVDDTALDEEADQTAVDQDEADEEAIAEAERQADATGEADAGDDETGASAAAETATDEDETATDADETAGSDDAGPEAGATDDDVEAEPVDAADLEPKEPADGGEPLESVSGIGPAYANRLNEAGLESVADLVAADPAAVAEATGISEKRIGRWIDRAAEE